VATAKQPVLPTRILTISVGKTHITTHMKRASIISPSHPTSTANRPRPFSPHLDVHPTQQPPPPNGRPRPHFSIPPKAANPVKAKRFSPPPDLPSDSLYQPYPLDPIDAVPGAHLNDKRNITLSGEVLRSFGYIVAGLLVGPALGWHLKCDSGRW
jgi:hypothetical protein